MTFNLNYYFTMHKKTLAGCRSPINGRLVAKNTRARMEVGSNAIIVRLYSTDIIKCTVDGTIQFNCGSWHTRTTRSRLNKFSPSHVYFFSHKGQSVVNVKGYWWKFTDGMKITSSYEVIGAERAKMPKKQGRWMLLCFLEKMKVIDSIW